MQINYQTGRSGGSGLGCWIWGILIILLIGTGISMFFNFFFVAFPLLGVALVGYWIYSIYRGRKRRQAMQEQYQQQYENYYNQAETPKQTPPTGSVIDADYRVVDEQPIDEKPTNE